jgi:hypothetical protein
MRQTMNDVKQYIKEMTDSLETEAYIEFMRELGEWANNQAELQEYDDIDFNE